MPATDERPVPESRDSGTGTPLFVDDRLKIYLSTTRAEDAAEEILCPQQRGARPESTIASDRVPPETRVANTTTESTVREIQSCKCQLIWWIRRRILRSRRAGIYKGLPPEPEHAMTPERAVRRREWRTCNKRRSMLTVYRYIYIYKRSKSSTGASQTCCEAGI